MCPWKTPRTVYKVPVIQPYVEKDTPTCIPPHLFRGSITARSQTIMWMQRRSRRFDAEGPPFSCIRLRPYLAHASLHLLRILVVSFLS